MKPITDTLRVEELHAYREYAMQALGEREPPIVGTVVTASASGVQVTFRVPVGEEPPIGSRLTLDLNPVFEPAAPAPDLSESLE